MRLHRTRPAASQLHFKACMSPFSRTGGLPLGTRTFIDRRDAGRLLAQALIHHAGTDAVVLALPRGGVPVAAEVARVLGATLGVWVVRKLGVPTEPELGMGAIAEGPAVVLDRPIVDELRVPTSQILQVARREMKELARRVEQFRPTGPRPVVQRRRVILVDDGVATGVTMRAAIRAIKKQRPAWLAVAIPVGAPDTLATLRQEVDEVVCLHQPRDLRAIGAWYDDFRQVSNEEVVRILQRAPP